MNRAEAYQTDLKILGGIFVIYVVACIVVAILNAREYKRRSDLCKFCGGQERPALKDRPGLISERLVLRCEDCGKERPLCGAAEN